MACNKQIQAPLSIIQDTREQAPLRFAGMSDVTSVEVRKLDTGDYSTARLVGLVGVERKSLVDLANTLGTGRARFQAELERSRGFKEFHIVIAASLSQTLAYPAGAGLPTAVRGRIRINGGYLSRRLVEIASEYGTYVWFADSEANAARLVVNILKTAEKKYLAPTSGEEN